MQMNITFVNDYLFVVSRRTPNCTSIYHGEIKTDYSDDIRKSLSSGNYNYLICGSIMAIQLSTQFNQYISYGVVIICNLKNKILNHNNNANNNSNTDELTNLIVNNYDEIIQDYIKDKQKCIKEYETKLKLINPDNYYEIQELISKIEQLYLDIFNECIKINMKYSQPQFNLYVTRV